MYSSTKFLYTHVCEHSVKERYVEVSVEVSVVENSNLVGP